MDVRPPTRQQAIPQQTCWGLATLVLTLGSYACDAPIVPADLVLTGGRVITVDGEHPEAQALAITGHTITAVGSEVEVALYVGEGTEVIDLEGRLVIPGLIEGHGHFMGLGQSKLRLDLTTAASWDDIVALVAEAAASAAPGEWILGRGWHQEKWSEVPFPNVDGVPLHEGLTAVSPNNPVYLTHASGHASFANAAAMAEARIRAGTMAPIGGTIVRDDTGAATGLMRENAQDVFEDAIAQARSSMTPEAVEAELREVVRLAGEDALSKGVTSFQDAGSNFETIDFLRKLEEEGALPVRLYVMVRFESNESMRARLPDYRMVFDGGNDFLTLRAIKRQIDGALGSHGAWLLEPYEDLPTTSGLVLEPLAEIRETATIALANGFQVNTHAIGDRANKEVLDLYEEAFADMEGSSGLRWRIEHAQHLDPTDIPRFVELGVIASMQGIHQASDAPWVLRRLGAERAESGAYLWRSLIDAGVVVTNGTDVPVEDIDPLESFSASVTRLSKAGALFFPEQAMTRMEALESYTINGAYSAFEERYKGSLTAGKLADIVVLSRDILTIPAVELNDARVDLTILGGEVRYRREGN